jgi:hypothetical protein
LSAAVVVGAVWRRSKQCSDITLDEAVGRAQLATVSVTGSDVDPQATVLASLIRVDQVHIRAIALLIPFILEAGSALGFAIIATAANAVPSAATTRYPLPTGHTTTRHANPARLRTSDGVIRRWALSELDIDPGSSMPARRAYETFCNWVRGVSSRPPRPRPAVYKGDSDTGREQEEDPEGRCLRRHSSGRSPSCCAGSTRIWRTIATSPMKATN